MVVLAIRRLLVLPLLTWVVLTITFFALRIAAGGPTALYSNPTVPPTKQTSLSRALGLDRPIAIQYVTWLGRSLRGDWGVSLSSGRPVTRVLAEHLAPSVLLGAAAIAVAVVIGLPLGLFAAGRAGSTCDVTIRTVSLAVYSTPTFWLGLLAISVFSYRLSIFPPGHLRSLESLGESSKAFVGDVLYHLALPALVVGLSLAPAITRLARASLVDTLRSGHIDAARARGLGETRILLCHALPLALPAAIQVVGLSLPMLAGGVLVTEVVFSWPGMGRLTQLAVASRDYPVVLGATAVTTIGVAAGSLMADLLHAWIDPRVYQARSNR